MYCKVCGELINNNDKICPKCGSFVEEIEILDDFDDDIVEEVVIDEDQGKINEEVIKPKVNNKKEVLKKNKSIELKKNKKPFVFKIDKENKFLFIIISILIVLILGVSFSIYYLSYGRFKITNCVQNVKGDAYKVTAIKQLYYLDKQVYKIKSTETIVSNKTELINYYNDLYNEQFKQMYSSLDYVKYSVKKKEGKVFAKSVANYSNKEYRDIEFLSWLENGKISYDAVIKSFNESGFDCK